MNIDKWFPSIVLCLIMIACQNEDGDLDQGLDDYLQENSELELAELIACAAGRSNGLSGNANFPTDVFFYPIAGATDFRYYESIDTDNPLDYSKYRPVILDDEPVFNGYLWKFNRDPYEADRYGIVTYHTDGKIHICDPIRLKTYDKPTEVNPDLVVIRSNGVNPTFTWTDGELQENVIYFQVISDSEGNLISGTYTFDKEFQFYDLQNVVLNITDPESSPALELNTEYQFTMMGVSEDNWVNLLIDVSFETE